MNAMRTLRRDKLSVDTCSTPIVLIFVRLVIDETRG